MGQSNDDDDDAKDTAILSNKGGIQTAVAVLTVKVNALDKTLSHLDKKLDTFFNEVKNNYATKMELKDVKDDVDKVNANIGWLVKIVVGAVVTGLLGLLLVKGGVPH